MMGLVHRNAIANIIGSATIAVLTIAITPVQISILGMEAYAIIGFIATLQVAFTAFDFGLSATIARELAADQSRGKVHSGPLVQTAMTVYWAIALVVGGILVALASPIANIWFDPAGMGADDLSYSLQVIAFYLALRWPVALYSGILSGVQKMELLNGVKISSGIFRLLGGIMVLWQSGSLNLFLWWTVASAIVEVTAFHFACRRSLPQIRLKIAFSTKAVRQVWRFSLIMNGLGILAIIIVQIDRLVISGILPLKELGFYNLAYSAASVIPIIVAAIGSAVMPSLAATYNNNLVTSKTVDLYFEADKFTLFLSTLVAFSLIAYSEPLLKLWVGSSNSVDSILPLTILAFGFWLASVISNCYNIAVSRAEPKRYLTANMVIIIPYVGLTYLGTKYFGILGAAGSWVFLYIFYFIFIVRFIHKNILGISTILWLTNIVFPFLLTGIITIILPRYFAFYMQMDDTLFANALLCTFTSMFYITTILTLNGGIRKFIPMLQKVKNARVRP